MKTAVLVIDMQRRVLETVPAPHELGVVIERINQIAAQARNRQLPVIFTQYEIDGFMEFGSEGWSLHPELIREESDIQLRKRTADPFLSSNLDARLKSMAVSDLIVCGFSTEICVDTTVRRASGLGYGIQLVADAHTTHDKAHLSAHKIREHHNITLSMSPAITAPHHDQIVYA